MSLEQLWAGWRSGYVNSVTQRDDDELAPEDAGGCVFCRILADPSPDKERGVVHMSRSAVALLNAYPYVSGHLLVLPQRHLSALEELSLEEANDLWALSREAVQAITTAYLPDGMNLGANLGRAAGAGIPAHLHLHVLPRWLGDTNFMTTVANTRVLPENLDESWEKLSASWPKSP